MAQSRHEYVIDAENRWAVITYRGPVTAEGALGMLRQVASDPAWRSEYGRMLVYDGGEYGDLNPEGMRNLAAGLVELRKARTTQETPRTAHVCADPIKRTVVLHWLAAIGSMDQSTNEVFHSRAQAEAWLADKTA